jgi:hypothetical protein
MKLKNARLSLEQLCQRWTCAPADVHRLVVKYGLPAYVDGDKRYQEYYYVDQQGDPIPNSRFLRISRRDGLPLEKDAGPLFKPEEVAAFVDQYPDLFRSDGSTSVAEAGRKGGKASPKLDPLRVVELVGFISEWWRRHPEGTFEQAQRDSRRDFGDVPKNLHKDIARLFDLRENRPGAPRKHDIEFSDPVVKLAAFMRNWYAEHPRGGATQVVQASMDTFGDVEKGVREAMARVCLPPANK